MNGYDEPEGVDKNHVNVESKHPSPLNKALDAVLFWGLHQRQHEKIQKKHMPYAQALRFTA